MNTEVLQNNPFLDALFDHIPNLELNCGTKQWILCIPQLATLPSSHKLSLNLLKSHVLTPGNTSNEFITLSGHRVCRLNEKELQIYESTSENRVVTILFSEVVYSGLRGDEAYTLLCLSRPFIGTGAVPLLPDGTELFLEERSAEAWTQILFPTKEKIQQLHALEARIASMPNPLLAAANNNNNGRDCQSYVAIRKASANWAQQQVKDDELFYSAQTNSRFFLLLQTAFESCAMLICHPVVFASLAQYHSDAEQDLQQRLHDLRRIVVDTEKGGAVDACGLSREFLDRFQTDGDAAFQSSVSYLQQINAVKSPLEKLNLLKSASHALRAMESNVNMDDALPLFLLAVLHAAPGLLLANLSYVVDFAPRAWLKANGELSFHATVFQGALTLIQNHTPSIDEASLLRNLIIVGGSGLRSGGGGVSKKPPLSSPPPPTSSFWVCTSRS